MLICTVLPSGTSKQDKILLNTEAVSEASHHITPIPNPDQYRDDYLRMAYEQYGVDDSLAFVGALALGYLMEEEISHLHLFDTLKHLKGMKTDPRRTPREMCEVIHEIGGILDKHCNYALTDGWFEDVKNTDTSPFYLASFDRVANSVDSIKGTLLLGRPVMASLFVDEEFVNLKGDWEGHSWSNDNRFGNRGLGYLMVLITGFDSEAGRFLCKTNQPKSWGDSGQLGLPYSKVDEFKNEYWALKEFEVEAG